MTKWNLTLAVIGLTLVFARDVAASEPDWEAEVAESIQSATRRSYLAEKKASQSQWDGFMRRFPNSKETSELQKKQLSELFAAKKWNEYLLAVKPWLQRSQNRPDLQSSVLYELARMANNSEIPDAGRAGAFALISERLQHRAWLTGYLRNSIARSPGSAAEHYAVFRKLTETCGPGPSLGPPLWSFILPLTQEGPEDTAARACQDFLKTYGEDHPEGRAARLWLFEHEGNTADADQLKQENADAKKTAAEVLRALDAAVAANDLPSAQQALQKFIQTVPRFERVSDWPAIFKTLQTADSTVRLSLLEQGLEDIPAGNLRDGARKFLIDGYRLAPEKSEVLLKALAGVNDDRGRTAANWRYALASIPMFKNEDAVRVNAYLQAAAAMKDLELDELETEYLYEACRWGWSLDREKTLERLRTIAPAYKKYPSAAKAGWLLAVLEGRQPLTFPGVQRPWQPPAEENPDFTLVATDPLARGTGTPAEKRTQFDSATNLLDVGAAKTVEGVAVPLSREPWRPKNLPATLLIPLKQTATVERISLEAIEPLHFVVSLLGTQGHVLARYERSWEIWEHLPAGHLWPDAKVDLKIPPVDGVRELRLEIHGAEGEVGIRQVTAHAPPYPMTEWVVGPAIPLPPEARGITLRSELSEPESVREYFIDSEETRGFPMMRWEAPWKKFGKNPANLRMLGGHLAFQFYGDAVTVEASRPGALVWNLGGTGGEIRQTEKDAKNVTAYPLATDLPVGLQVLRLGAKPLPNENDAYAPNDTQINGFKVSGRARAALALRFSTDNKNWSGWFGPVHETVAIPAEVDGKRPRFAQAGIWFDSRTVRGSATAEVRALEIVPGPEAGTSLLPWKDEAPRLVENLTEAARLLGERRVTVVYPKTGSRAEYDAARALADQARVYLVSDDLGLNSYPALPLVVGTPLRNRYTRQLLASHALWQDRGYLNNPEGLVLVIPDDQTGEPMAIYVTGETAEAVIRAAGRLRAAVSQAPAPTAPFRVFASNPLEMVYAWDLRPDRAAPTSLDLQLGRGDKRSLQLGVAAGRELKDFQVDWTDLAGPSGAKLPKSALRARVAAFYEWIPFFGDLRLPNALTVEPPLPVPADSAFGLWITVNTPTDLTPGTYRGEISLRSGEKTVCLPLNVRVEDFAMPHLSTVPTYSFAQVPYWFVKGSAPWETAVASLAENEASQGVSYLSALNDFTAVKTPSFAPVKQRVGDSGAWVLCPDRTEVSEDGSLALEFARTVEAQLLSVGVLKAASAGEWVLEQSADDGATWSPLATATLPEKENRVLFFPLKGAPLEIIRIRPVDGGAFEIAKVRAFAGGEPFHGDFSLLARQLDLMDDVYQKRGLPLPSYILQSSSALPLLSSDLLGVPDGGLSLVGTYARELVAFLKKCGRSDRLLFKVGDEPSDIAVWARMAKPYHDAGLRTMTCHSDKYPNIDLAVGLLDPLVPNYQHNINLPFFQKRREAGDSLWWYICGVPVTRLTGSPIENLPFYWLTAKWNLQGAMNYAAMHSSNYSMPVPFRYEHGLDHRILFLPDGSVLDTTRRELEGDGIRDMEMIFAIRRQLDKMPDPTKARAIQTRLDALLAKMVPYKYGYPEDPQVWLEARHELYALAREVRPWK